MKTNVILNSSDRNLFGVTISQNTNNFLSISDLQEAYTIARVKNGWLDRRISEIMTYTETYDRIYFILKEQKLINTSQNAFIEEVKSKTLIKVLKQYGVYKTTGARGNKNTFCNVYIWMMLAMELHPEIYAKVIIWATDNLIINRIEAGDKYNELCRSASKFSDVDYRSIAKGLNYIVFGIHETMIRNTANSSQLKELDELQKSLAFSIDMGYIKSFNDLIEQMRILYKNKKNNN